MAKLPTHRLSLLRPARLALLATSAVALSVAGCASPASTRPSPAVTAGTWPVPDKAYFIARIAPPPAPGSAAERRDIRKVLELQSHATPQKIASAQRTLNLSVFTFAKAVGPDFDPERFPQTAAFFRRLNDIIRTTNDGLKAHFKRPHPFETDPRIRRFVVAPAKYSYPSYHSARCVVFWRTLARLDHRAAAAFHAIAFQVERERVFAGEHFPTDITAGRIEGRLIFEALERDPDFRSDLRRLKAAEWTPAPRTRNPSDAVNFVSSAGGSGPCPPAPGGAGPLRRNLQGGRPTPAGPPGG